MKKITKRIMALMLSLVMVLGCIPSFINEASADTTKKKIQEILQMAENFPTTAAQAWVNENGYLVFLNDNMLRFSKPIGEGNASIATWNEASSTDGGNTYVYSNIEINFTLNISNEKLTSFNVTEHSYDQSYLGTYEPVQKTIEDVLNTVEGGFPTGTDDDIPDNAWVTNNGYKIYINASHLCVSDASEENLYMLNPTTDTATSSDDSKYTATTNSLTITFNMNDNKLTSIEITGTADYVGTYKPAPTPIEKVNLVSSGVLAKNVQSLKYEADEGDNAPYTISEDGKWYTDNYDVLYDFSNTGTAYKRLTLTPKDGYKFDLNTTISIKGTGTLFSKTLNNGNCQVNITAEVEENHTKSATITLPITAGTTVEQIKNNISITTTATKGLATIDKNNDNNILVYDIDNTEYAKANSYALELNKEYYIQITIDDAEHFAYTSIDINNTTVTQCNFSDPAEIKLNNHFYFPWAPNKIVAGYKFKAVEPTTSGRSSKKYKTTNTSNSAEKISGSGKKGSNRTITPIEGKKVSSVIVTDKDGNKVDVTLNEDGTYSFVQPASDVQVEVTYVNREITLTIGSTEADVDGERSNLDVSPVIRNDRTMLPIRFVAENLGAKVEWDEKHPEYVLITRGDIKIEITLGSDKAKVNGKEYKLDSVAFAENDRTYLPVRFVSEQLNAIVEWNEAKPMEVKIYER